MAKLTSLTYTVTIHDIDIVAFTKKITQIITFTQVNLFNHKL